MVRIRVVSDLHLEAGDLEVPNAGENVVVLAGDVHVGIHSARWSLGLSAKSGPWPLLSTIAGNTLLASSAFRTHSNASSGPASPDVETGPHSVLLAAKSMAIPFFAQRIWF